PTTAAPRPDPCVPARRAGEGHSMRRRHQMRPDTFPFLAVLLCAMGSLLLLLVVMDRRAKAVARARALQAAAARSAEEAERDAAALREREEREAEWQRRREELHTALAHQEEDL